MRLGVMQPYFFPHTAHFALIAHTDRWVVFDTTQYTPKRWMNRNRVLNGSTGLKAGAKLNDGESWSWLTVPVRHVHRSAPVSEVMTNDLAGAKRKILGQLAHYRRHAPFASTVVDLVGDVMTTTGDEPLVDLDTRGLSAVCSYLGLPFNWARLSKLDLSLPPVDHPGGWAPAISSATGADEYLNPIGGRHLFSTVEFCSAGVRLLFCDAQPMPYETGPYEPVPGLSIIDALMWCSPQQIVDNLASARIVLAPDTEVTAVA